MASVTLTDAAKKYATADKVRLNAATELGQAVFGTSGGSTYYVCAIHKEFNIAMRDKAGTISLRVEPNGKDELDLGVIALLKQVGFGGEGHDYLSQHFKTEGGALASCGAYGAVMEQIFHLFGTGSIDRLLWGDILSKGN